MYIYIYIYILSYIFINLILIIFIETTKLINLLIYPINLFFYYVFKFMKTNFNLKPSQYYINVSI